MTLAFEAGGSVMPTFGAARRFTATRTLAYACARYVDDVGQTLPRPQEVVYRDGSYHYPYSLSSMASLGGGVTRYTVQRAGGWPRNLALHAEEVPEVPALPTGAQRFGVIYGVDFRTLATQAMSPGAYTIDGLTWYACGGSGAQSAGLVNGAGLQLYSPSGSGSGYPVGNIGYKHFKLPLAQVPGIDLAAPLLILARIAVVHTGGHDPFGWIALVDAPSDTSSVTSAQRATGVAAGLYGFVDESTGSYTKAAIGDSTVDVVSIENPDALRFDSGDLVGLICPTPRNTNAVFMPWSGVTPDVTTLHYSSTMVPQSRPPRSNPTLVYTFNAQNGLTNTFNMTHLWVMQPKVAA